MRDWRGQTSGRRGPDGVGEGVLHWNVIEATLLCIADKIDRLAAEGEDSERLDWWLTHYVEMRYPPESPCEVWFYKTNRLAGKGDTPRAAIDAARKEQA